MNKELLSKLNNKYAEEGLNLMQAIKVWGETDLTPDEIKYQIRNDIRKEVTASDAQELYHLGKSMQSDYTAITKDFEVSKGREDLIPENIKDRPKKLNPALRMAMDKVGQNLYRDKVAKTYWTLKEKTGDNGQKAIYLVAVEEPDDIKKQAGDFFNDPRQTIRQNIQGPYQQDYSTYKNQPEKKQQGPTYEQQMQKIDQAQAAAAAEAKAKQLDEQRQNERRMRDMQEFMAKQQGEQDQGQIAEQGFPRTPSGAIRDYGREKGI